MGGADSSGCGCGPRLVSVSLRTSKASDSSAPTPATSDQRPAGVLAYAPLRSSLKRRLGGITLRPHKTCLPSGKARPGERLLWGRMGDPYPLRQQSPVCLDVSSPIPLTILTFPQTIRNIIPSTGPILGKMHTRILL